MKTILLIPCYNEESSLETLINEIKVVLHEDNSLDILVVNDSSTDSTLEVISKLKLNHLNLSVNLGIGGAVQSGFLYAYENRYDVAVQIDGDGQHPVQELHKVLAPILNKEADVVIGSRFIEKNGFQSTGLRRFGIHYFKWLNKLLLGITITDSTSGYRALNKRAIELACAYYPDEYPEPEAIVLFHLNGLKIKEVPVAMKERQGGKSSISSLKSVYYMIKVTLGILFIFIRIKFYGKRSPL